MFKSYFNYSIRFYSNYKSYSNHIIWFICFTDNAHCVTAVHKHFPTVLGTLGWRWRRKVDKVRVPLVKSVSTALCEQLGLFLFLTRHRHLPLIWLPRQLTGDRQWAGKVVVLKWKNTLIEPVFCSTITSLLHSWSASILRPDSDSQESPSQQLNTWTFLYKYLLTRLQYPYFMTSMEYWSSASVNPRCPVLGWCKILQPVFFSTSCSLDDAADLLDVVWFLYFTEPWRWISILEW